MENSNHHHRHGHHDHGGDEEEALSASLQEFRNRVSNITSQLLSNPTSDFLCLSWIQLCLQILDTVNKCFANFVVEINYPMKIWEPRPVEEYLNWSMDFLELLNSVSAEISRLRQARLPLANALSLVVNSPSLAVQSLQIIEPKRSSTEFKESVTKSEEQPGSGSGKERVVLEAMMEVKGFGFWIFGVILASLSGDADAYLEMKRFSVLDSVGEEIFCKGFGLKEVNEVNVAVNSLVMSVASTGNHCSKNCSVEAEELQKRLEAYEKMLDGLGVEIDRLFSEVLAGRNELLATIRQKMISLPEETNCSLQFDINILHNCKYNLEINKGLYESSDCDRYPYKAGMRKCRH